MGLWIIFIAPVGAALLCAVRGGLPYLDGVSKIAASLSLAVCALLGAIITIDGPMPHSGLYADYLSVLMAGIISIVYAAAAFNSADYLAREASGREERTMSHRFYFALLHTFAAALYLTVFTENMGVMWIAVEATTLSTAFLVGFYRNRHSLEAAWKYVILCSIAIAFAMFGTTVMYFASLKVGGTPTLGWLTFMANAGQMNDSLVKLAFLCAAIGYGAKAGLAPLHFWLPDAHSQAPSPISAMLSGVLLPTAFYALLRFYAVTVKAIGPAYPCAVLTLFGLLSLAIAAPFIIAARDAKRMLAFSSVEHMGVIALCIAAGTPLGFFAAGLHMIGHAMAKSMAFLSVGYLVEQAKTRKISRLAGSLSSFPQAATVFLLASLALAGLPPFSIFTSKFGMITALAQAGQVKTAAIAAILLAAVGAGLFRHTITIVFGTRPLSKKPQPAGHSDKPHTLPAGMLVWACVFLLTLAVLGVYLPHWLKDLISAAHTSITGQDALWL